MVSIRKANMEDYEFLLEVFKEGDIHHSSALPNIFKESEEIFRTKDYIRSIIENDDAILLVAEDKGKIAGILYGFITKAPDIPIMVKRNYAIVDCLAVKREYRKKGIGKSLMEEIHKWILYNDVSEIELNVYEFNDSAKKLYEGLGYEARSRKMYIDL